MNFYMDVQFIEEKEDRSIFEVVFSNYSDDKKIEKIIAGGLNTFQKRNPYIKVEDGFIEFFEDNSIKLRIESTCKYPLSKRRIEDLKQELIVAFKMTSEERTRLESKQQLENKDKAVLTAIQDLKDEWRSQVTNQLNELKQEFSSQLMTIQPAIKEEVGQQLYVAEEQRTLSYQELQQSLALDNDLMTEHLETIIQKEKSSSAQMKKRFAALDTFIGQREEVLKSALTEVYQDMAAKQLEKVDSLSKTLSNELDESGFELKEEINLLNITLSQKLEENDRKVSDNLQKLGVGLAADKESAVEQAAQVDQRFTGLIEKLDQVHQQVEPLSALFETNEKQLTEKMTGFEKSFNALDEKLEKLPVFSPEEDNHQILTGISALSEQLETKIETEISKISDALKAIPSESSESVSRVEDTVAFEEQLAMMKQLLKDNMDQIKPLFSTLQKENNVLNRKIDNLEAAFSKQEALLKKEQSLVEKEEEIKADMTEAAVEETPSEPVVSVEEVKPASAVVQEVLKTLQNSDKPEEKAAPVETKEPERKIKKIEPLSNPIREKRKTAKQEEPKRVVPPSPLPEKEEKKSPPKEHPTVNPFLTDFQSLEQRFQELESSPRFDKLVRLSKLDYRKSITHVHYIEYRWENAALNKADYAFFGLDTFEERIKELPEFLEELKSDNKKESLFNQNSFKLKKSVWEKIKVYHLLSIYLDQILTWRQS